MMDMFFIFFFFFYFFATAAAVAIMEIKVLDILEVGAARLVIESKDFVDIDKLR